MAKQNSIKIGQQNQAYIMKNVKQRLNSNQKEHQDDTDGSVNYESLKEDLPGEDLDEVTDTEFYNPVFKPRPVYNSNLGVVEDYDKLNFTPRTTPKASPNSIRKNQGEADKQIEEIEMMGVKNGVNNYGYIHDRNRPNSWESDLSAINPVSTAIRNPVNIPPRRVPSVGMEMSESPPRDYANSISKQSAYSSVSDANPYLSSSDKDPQYEVLPRKDFNRQVVEQRQSGSKKINMLYESAVITEKSEKYRKRSVDEAASYDDSSNCCHLTFTILTGILAVVALVVVFLMVFGVIKCKDCDDSTVTPSASAQAQGFEARLKILQDNLTQLKNEMHTNSSDVIVALRKELEEQKALVTSLNNALQTQKQLTDQLNATIKIVKESTLQNKETNKNLEKKIISNNDLIKNNQRDIANQEPRITNANTFVSLLKNTVEGKLALLNSKVKDISEKKLDTKEFASYKNRTDKLLMVTDGSVIQNGIEIRKIENDVKSMKSDITNSIDTKLMKLQNDDNHLNKTLNNLSIRVSNITLIPGPEGPRGFNGSRGDMGIPGKDASFDKCSTEKLSTTANVQNNFDQKKVFITSKLGRNVVSATCNQGLASRTHLEKLPDGKFKCTCTGFPHEQGDYKCEIFYWYC